MMADVEAFTEYGYVEEFPDGSWGAVELLAVERNPASSFERKRAAGVFRAIVHGEFETRYVFVSRRVTHTPWVEEGTA